MPDAIEMVTAVARALETGGHLLEPFVERSFAQQYEKEHQTRIKEWGSILGDQNISSRADRMHVFVTSLLQHTGQATGGMGTCISVPVDVLNALVTTLSENIKNEALLERVQFRNK